jgi:hypothetical protein
MKKHIILVGFVVAALAACGGKKPQQTTPENKGGSTTEIKGTGGQTYGSGASQPIKQTGGADPCGG